MNLTEQKELNCVHVIGGGLAGVEAAWQALRVGCKVVLHEMRPVRSTDAHKTSNLAELVCSNSLKSLVEGSAAASLKYEMKQFDSLVIEAAHHARVPAGQALAVDREIFSKYIEAKLSDNSNFKLNRAEITQIPSNEELEEANSVCVIATGPLSSDAIAKELQRLSGSEDRLFFYDAIAPVIDADSIKMDEVFRADRYSEEEGAGDYLNIPLSKEQYEQFIDDLETSEKAPLHDFENTKYFEACLPIEVMAERGRETLRFGPMKPVGLTDPKTGRYPYAAIQLRQENTQGSIYSMVGFQTKMKWGAQKEVFKKFPGLGDADFVRMGSVHRNTYLQSPNCLRANLSFKLSDRVFLAGQVTGVEGYTESAAIGLLAGQVAANLVKRVDFPLPPAATVIGALLDYVTKGCKGPYSPMNANLGLLPTIPKKRGVSKKEKKLQQCMAAKETFDRYFDSF